MIVQDDKFGSFGRSVARSIPEQGDSDRRIPPVTLDSISIPYATQNFPQPVFSTLTVGQWNTSGMTGFHRLRAAAAALEVTRLWVLGPGLWRFRLNAWVLIPSATVTEMSLETGYGDPNVGMNTGQIFTFNSWNPNIWPIPFGPIELDIAIPNTFVFRADLRMDNTGGTAPMAFSGWWSATRYA